MPGTPAKRSMCPPDTLRAQREQEAILALLGRRTSRGHLMSALAPPECLPGTFITTPVWRTVLHSGVGS